MTLPVVQPRPALDFVLPSAPAVTSWVSRRTVVTIGIFLTVLGLFLTQTRLPATLLKLETADRAQSARGRVGFAQVIDPETLPGWLQWLAYGVNLWDGNAIGMFFAMLLAGAAAGMFAPATRLRGVLTRRGAAGAGVGGMLGVPLMMCSACSAPVSLGFRRSGASVETSLGVVVGSALFNPIGLIALFVALPLSMGLSRVGFGLIALFLLVPLAARFGRPGFESESESCALPVSGVDAPTVPVETWRAAARGAGQDWLRASAEVAWRLGPIMLAATLVVGVVFTLVPPQTLSDRAGTGILAVVIAALIGTLLQTPALFEIPLVLGLLFLGLGIGPAVALLITAPAPGLITLALTRRELGWRAPFVLMAGTFAAGVTGGVLLGAL